MLHFFYNLDLQMCSIVFCRMVLGLIWFVGWQFSGLLWVDVL